MPWCKAGRALGELYDTGSTDLAGVLAGGVATVYEHTTLSHKSLGYPIICDITIRVIPM